MSVVEPDYQLRLAEIAPSVAFGVEWTLDPDCVWDGDEDFPIEDYVAYDTDVYAKAIVAGVEIEGVARMGGTWEKREEIDPEIGGYLPQMLLGAAEDLFEIAGASPAICTELLAAITFLKQVLQERYDAQMKGVSK